MNISIEQLKVEPVSGHGVSLEFPIIIQKSVSNNDVYFGLDNLLNIINVLREGMDDNKYVPAPLLIQMVEESKLGRKTG
jgi:hypothetical protein